VGTDLRRYDIWSHAIPQRLPALGLQKPGRDEVGTCPAVEAAIIALMDFAGLIK